MVNLREDPPRGAAENALLAALVEASQDPRRLVLTTHGAHGGGERHVGHEEKGDRDEGTPDAHRLPLSGDEEQTCQPAAAQHDREEGVVPGHDRR